MKAVLLSGGMDSIALAFWKRPTIAITVDYGQLPADAEIRAAAQVSVELGMRHEVIRADCSSLGSGDMAGRPAIDAAPIPEWWPYRNQLLITLAAIRAIELRVEALMLGTVTSDDVHADGRAEFYSAMDVVLKQQEGGIRVSVPALHLTTTQLIRTSGVPRSILAWAHSCHVGNLACGACRGCLKHYYVTNEVFGDAY